MNVNSRTKIWIYLIVLFFLTYLMVKEYTYIHPFNVGFGWLGPRWTYISTRSEGWYFLLGSSIVMMTPLFRKQAIGFSGILLLMAVLVRPHVHEKFPEETAKDFYMDRKVELNKIVMERKPPVNIDLHIYEIEDLGLGTLFIKDGTYYFFIFDSGWPFGICYDEDGKLPDKNFGWKLKYYKLDKNWYEFEN